MTFFFVRHGKTEYNEKRQYCGALDPELSSLGRQELEASDIKQLLAENPPDLVFSSPMKRAVETAELLCEGRPSVPLIVNEELREIDFGDFEGKSYEELKDDPAYCAWLDTNCEGPIPNGDFPDMFREDAVCGFESILESCAPERPERVLVVTHGGVIGAILETYAEPRKHWYDYSIPCGGYVVWENHKIQTSGGGAKC